MNPENRPLDPLDFDARALPWQELKTKPKDAVNALQLALLVEGVDVSGWPGGLTSAMHTEADVAATVDAFSRAADRLKREGFPKASAD